MVRWLLAVLYDFEELARESHRLMENVRINEGTSLIKANSPLRVCRARGDSILLIIPRLNVPWAVYGSHVPKPPVITRQNLIINKTLIIIIKGLPVARKEGPFQRQN